jgi:signal transduction histidine kinase
MPLFRLTALALDLVILALSFWSFSESFRSAMPHFSAQLLVLCAGSGFCSLLQVIPPFRRSKIALLAATLKSLTFALLFAELAESGLSFLPLWLGYSAMLAAYWGPRVFGIQTAVAAGAGALLLVLFPSLAGNWFIQIPELILLAFSMTAIAGLLLFCRSQAVRLAENRRRLGTFERDLQRVMDANVGYQEYSSLVEQHALREERDRISREIHDSTGYALTTVKMAFEAAKGLWGGDKRRFDELMDQGIALSKQALAEIRAALRQLRARRDPAAEGLSFVTRLIRNFEKVTSVAVEFDYSNARRSYTPEINGLIYKMVQECLANAYRHGRASAVKLVLSEGDDTLRISIRDNGRPASTIVKGIGMQGMEERVQGAGGTIVFAPTATGFETSAEIPIRPEATHA